MKYLAIIGLAACGLLAGAMAWHDATARAQDATPVSYRPAGEYARNCNQCRRDGTWLRCRCDTVRMEARNASIDLAACPFEDNGGVRTVTLQNSDGTLLCKK